MTCVLLYTVVVEGRETNLRAPFAEAQGFAKKLRNMHTAYDVWLRPHFAIV